jgi:hypothetical protein
MSQSPSLTDNPHQQFPEYQRIIFNAASNVCLSFDPHGLMFQVASDLIWAGLEGNTAIVNGVPAVVARPTPQRPLAPAEGATHGAWNSYSHRMKEYVIYAEETAKLKALIKDSLPEVDRSALNDPLFGLAQRSALTIMEHLRAQYGVLRATDYIALNEKLRMRMDPAGDVVANAANHSLIHAQLAASGQPSSELLKITTFVSTITHISYLQRTYEAYVQTVPQPHLQTYRDLVAYMALHAPNLKPTAVDLGYTAASAAATNAPMILTEYLASPAFAAIVTAAAAAINIAPARRSRGGKDKNKTHQADSQVTLHTPASTNRVYCFVHGYDWHQGTACRRMADPRHAADYSNAHRTAATHTAMPRGCPHKL